MIKKNMKKLAKLISLPLLGPYCSGAPWSSKVTLIIKKLVIFSASCGRSKIFESEYCCVLGMFARCAGRSMGITRL